MKADYSKDNDDFWCALWIVDITDEPAVEGMSGYLSAMPPKAVRQFAHKIHCCNIYKGKKRVKAIRRFIRLINKTCPELWKEALATLMQWRKEWAPDDAKYLLKENPKLKDLSLFTVKPNKTDVVLTYGDDCYVMDVFIYEEIKKTIAEQS